MCTPEKGKARVPHGDDKIEEFILGKFKPAEIEIIKKTFKKASEAIVSIIGDGRERAMNMFN